MAVELPALLLQFQPESEDLKSRQKYDQAAKAFVKQLDNVSASHWSKGADTPQDVLEILNPTVNSIAYAFALRHRISAAVDKKSTDAVPGGALWNKLVLFLETFDSVQIRYAGQEYRKLVDYAESLARNAGSPGLAIAPIRSAMIRLDPTTGTFTSTHVDFVRLCLETRSYAAAEPILDNYIHSLPSQIPAPVREGSEYSVVAADVARSGEFMHKNSGHSDKVTFVDVQEYYVLGAMAYLGLRQFKKAQHFLEHVLIMPSANVANGLMLEAYKKWVLLNCLVSDEPKAIPRSANATAIKQVRGASRAYEAVADAYGHLHNMAKLKAQINAGAQLWAEDGNTGLVKAVLDSQMRAYVSRLSKTYSAIPVSNIAEKVGGSADEAAQYLETLITGGQLNARLEQTNKPETGIVLRFYLDPTQGPLAKTEKQQQQALFEQTLRTNALADQVRDADYRLTLTKEFIENLKRQQKRQGPSGDAMDTAWDDGVEEEDIMNDL
jgi:COP9 signalosome complex subunit 3